MQPKPDQAATKKVATHHTDTSPRPRAVIYSRMSTDHRQYSTENQVDAIQEYATRYDGLPADRGVDEFGGVRQGWHGNDYYQKEVWITRHADFSQRLNYIFATVSLQPSFCTTIRLPSTSGAKDRANIFVSEVCLISLSRKCPAQFLNHEFQFLLLFIS